MLFWVITQQVVAISYRRFGTTCQSYPEGSRIKIKPIGPTRCSSWEECGRWKLSIAWCQPIGLLQVVWLEGSLVVSPVREREGLSSSFLFYFVIYYHLLYRLLLISSLFYSSPFCPSNSVPALHSTFQLRCTQLYTRCIYHAVALDYELPLLIFCNSLSFS